MEGPKRNHGKGSVVLCKSMIVSYFFYSTVFWGIQLDEQVRTCESYYTVQIFFYVVCQHR